MTENYIQKPVRVPEEDVQWFEEHYPQHGAWTDWVRRSLRAFRQLHHQSADELIELAQQEVSHHIDS